MITISNDTFQTFEDEALRRFAKELAPDIRKKNADILDGVDEDALLDLIVHGCRRAKAAGFSTGGGLAGWVATMFLYAPNFDRYPKAAEILSDPALNEEQRFKKLLKVMTLDDWNEVIRRSDETAWTRI